MNGVHYTEEFNHDAETKKEERWFKKEDMQCQSYMHRPKFEIKHLGLFKMLTW